MQRSPEEEVVNAATHLIASIGSFLSLLLFLILGDQPTKLMVAAIIMGGFATWTFFASYLYHSSKKRIDVHKNRILDKAAIYLMIAGCGCAMSLVVTEPLFGAISGIVILLLSSYFVGYLCIKKEMPESLSVASYVLLGWLSFMPATGLFYATPVTNGISFSLGIIGSVMYSLGVVFYVGDSNKWYHTAWHILAMAGFSFHFSALILIEMSV